MNEENSFDPMNQANLFSRPAIVINVGLSLFKDALEGQGIRVINVAWSPPPSMPEDIKQMLDQML